MLTRSPDHVYTLTLPGQEPRVLPGNTEILKDRGIIDTRWYTEGSRQRGTYVHQVTEMYDRARITGGDIVWDEVYEPWRGYCDAWCRFCGETDFKPLLVEQMLWHSSNYATTIDRLGVASGRLCLVEIKTGSVPKWVWLQMALQVQAVVESSQQGRLDGLPQFNKISEYPLCVAVCLKEDGRYSVHEGFMLGHLHDAQAHVRSYHSARDYNPSTGLSG